MKVEEEEVPGAADVYGKESKVVGRWIMQVWWEVNWREA